MPGRLRRLPHASRDPFRHLRRRSVPSVVVGDRNRHRSRDRGGAAQAFEGDDPAQDRGEERQIAQLQGCVLCRMSGEFRSWLECDSGFEVESCGRSHSVDASSFRNALETGPRGLVG